MWRPFQPTQPKSGAKRGWCVRPNGQTRRTKPRGSGGALGKAGANAPAPASPPSEPGPPSPRVRGSEGPKVRRFEAEVGCAEEAKRVCGLLLRLGPPSEVPFLLSFLFWGGGFQTTKVDYRRKLVPLF